LSARSSVNFTAAASSGVPSWNRTPGRSLKRTRVGEITSHDVASFGWSSSFSSIAINDSRMFE